jgi:hypothetical protein
MHKFHLRQTVAYQTADRDHAPGGTYVIVAKLGQRGGEFEYYIRSATGEHDERMAGESELSAIDDKALGRMGRQSVHDR